MLPKGRSAGFACSNARLSFPPATLGTGWLVRPFHSFLSFCTLSCSFHAKLEGLSPSEVTSFLAHRISVFERCFPGKGTSAAAEQPRCGIDPSRTHFPSTPTPPPRLGRPAVRPPSQYRSTSNPGLEVLRYWDGERTMGGGWGAGVENGRKCRAERQLPQFGAQGRG